MRHKTQGEQSSAREFRDWLSIHGLMILRLLLLSWTTFTYRTIVKSSWEHTLFGLPARSSCESKTFRILSSHGHVKGRLATLISTPTWETQSDTKAYNNIRPNLPQLVMSCFTVKYTIITISWTGKMCVTSGRLRQKYGCKL